MITKSDIIETLKTKIDEGLKNELTIHPIVNWLSEDCIKQIIKESASGEDAYRRLGKLLSESDSHFEDIYFREDCYDYLLTKGFDKIVAFELMEVIRKGQYRFEKYQITSDKLSDEFYKWAKGVKYLPSRKVLKEMAEEKTIYKTVIVKEFDKFYYKKLRKSMPEKIKNGEIEYIYAYGDKLIARGNKAVFESVKRIVETKETDNPYIESEVLYAKCCELYEKYKNKKLWFSWFK